MKPAVKYLLESALTLLLLLFVAGCATAKSTPELSPEEVQSQVNELQRAFSIGRTGFDEMRRKLGEPAERTDAADGTHAVWKAVYTVSRAIGAPPASIAEFDAASSAGAYRFAETRTITVDAYFDNEGILSACTVR